MKTAKRRAAEATLGKVQIENNVLDNAHRLGSNRLYEGGKRGQERGQERGLVTLQCAGRRGGPCERKFTRKRARFLEIGTSKLRHRHVRCSVGNWVD